MGSESFGITLVGNSGRLEIPKGRVLHVTEIRVEWRPVFDEPPDAHIIVTFSTNGRFVFTSTLAPNQFNRFGGLGVCVQPLVFTAERVGRPEEPLVIAAYEALGKPVPPEPTVSVTFHGSYNYP